MLHNNYDAISSGVIISGFTLSGYFCEIFPLIELAVLGDRREKFPMSDSRNTLDGGPDAT